MVLVWDPRMLCDNQFMRFPNMQLTRVISERYYQLLHNTVTFLYFVFSNENFHISLGKKVIFE